MNNRLIFAVAWTLIPTCLVLGADPPTELLKPKMTFADAVGPYEKLKYDYSGHIGQDGKVKGKGLGCSAFTSVVLHRMRDGENWLNNYDIRVHQWYGDAAAKHFALPSAGTYPPEKFRDAASVRGLVKDKELAPERLYLFNARREKNGHVGFVRFHADGTSEQWHFSSISNGLYQGEFGEWIGRSLYRAESKIELFVIPSLSSEQP